MKKSLIALAVLAASGASFAQSSVTVYGVLDTWLGSVGVTDAAGNKTTTTKLDAGGVSHNRFGFKGSEDLGGGLKANFTLEQGFTMDTGAHDAGSTGFNRYAYVGFSGGFGEIKLGKTGTAYDDVQGAADAVFDSALSPANSIFASTGYTWTPSNSVMYVTPTVGGFNGEISYALDEKATGAPAVTSFNVAYANGPVAVSVAYQTEKVYNAANSTDYTRLNGAYDFGVAKLMGSYGKVKYNTAGVGDVTEYQIGADYPVSAAVTLSGSYAESKTAAVGATAEVKKTGYGFAANYALSKRTSVYGGYTENKVKGTSVETTILAVGVRHAF